MVAYAPATQRRGRLGRYLAPLVLVVLIAAIVAVVVTLPGGGAAHSRTVRAAPGASAQGPRYWTVRSGNTLGQISAKTGLTIAQLEALNPSLDPNVLVPGERLNLRPPPPPPPAKPAGPRFWTVRPGQSFGSIAAKTGVDIATLEQLNPHLQSVTLQPGDRVRLRR